MQALPCRLHAGGRRAAAGFPASNICWPRGFPPCGSCVSGRRAPSSPAALLFWGRSLRAGRRRLILLMRASAAFCSFGGHKARSQSQSLASASPQRIIRCRSPDAAGPLGCGLCGVRGSPSAALSPWAAREVGAGLALGGFAAFGGVGICKTMREKLQKRRETEAKRMEICKINSCKFHLAIV